MVEGCLFVAIARTIPRHLADHPSLLDRTQTLFSAYVSPPDQLVLHQVYLLIPTSSIPVDLPSVLAIPILVKANVHIHMTSGQAGWVLEVFDVTFAAREASVNPASLAVVLRAVSAPQQLSEVSDFWIIQRIDQPEIQYWYGQVIMRQLILLIRDI